VADRVLLCDALVYRRGAVYDIDHPLARVFDAWGFERCLWGTDWTRAFAVVNYEQAVEPFRRPDRLTDSERAMLMGCACAKAYGWSPKKG
jgi:L-fuconolactonase